MQYLQQLLTLQPDQLVEELQALILSDSTDVGRYDRLFAMRDELNGLIGNIEAEVSNQLNIGLEVDGFAYKAGRKTRTVKDPTQLVDALSQYVERDELFETKLRPLSDVEKRLTAAGFKPAERDAILSPYIDVKAGKPKLVRE